MSPPASSREAAAVQALEIARITGSPGFPLDEEWITELSGQMWDLGYDMMGVMRQTVAIAASGDRSDHLRELRVPTLVVHGDSDPLIHVSAGKLTAELIPGAVLRVVPGMGHDLPRGIWPELAEWLIELADRADAVHKH